MVPVKMQESAVACEPTPARMSLVEAVRSMLDTTVRFGQRVGALRVLAKKQPDDFLIPRSYSLAMRRLRRAEVHFLLGAFYQQVAARTQRALVI